MMFRMHLYLLLWFGVTLLGCQTTSYMSSEQIGKLCKFATKNGEWDLSSAFSANQVKEAKRRGLSCGVNEVPDTQIAAKTKIRE